MFKTALVIAVAFLLTPPLAAAQSLWDKVKDGASSAADTVADTAASVTEKETPAESRKKIDSMASATLDRLFAEQNSAKALYDQSYGYAVFDTRKFSFLITTGFGAGVAVEKDSGQRTYMKMATGGVNVGLGGQFFQLVFLFENQAKFRKFVDEGFEAGTQASAVAGDDSAELGARFVNGVAVFQLTDKGLMLAADLTGTKYWKNSDLN